MPNKNYIKGVKKERKIVNEFRDMGFLSFRSAGSHSKIDVFCLNHYDMVIHLIQCKPDSMSNKKKQKLLDDLKKYEGFYTVKVSIE
ncbi:hypothetical protein M0R04_15620 [Candidatus Dojkabacteria bacterium]|jgi:Holliday junction resolvase|nr:hypothetical protein [Candidatus Dojkabacteria bacterium]